MPLPVFRFGGGCVKVCKLSENNRVYEKFFLKLYIYDCFACMYIRVWLMPMETRRTQQIPWKWGIDGCERSFGYWELNLDFLKE